MTRLMEAGMRLVKPAPIYVTDTADYPADKEKFLSSAAITRYEELNKRFGVRFFGVRVAFPTYNPIKNYSHIDDTFYSKLAQILPKDCEIAVSGPMDQLFMDHLDKVALNHAFQVFVGIPWFNTTTPLTIPNLVLPKKLPDTLCYVFGPTYESCGVSEAQWWKLLKDWNLDGLCLSRYQYLARNLFDLGMGGSLRFSEKLVSFMEESSKIIYVYSDTDAMDAYRLHFSTSSNTRPYTPPVVKYFLPSLEEIE